MRPIKLFIVHLIKSSLTFPLGSFADDSALSTLFLSAGNIL